MKTLPIALFAALALLVGSAASAASGPAHGGMLGVVTHRGAARITPNASSRTAAAGAAATCGISCSAYETAINQYFTDVAHDSGTTSNVYSVATQYSSIAYNSTFAGSTVDTNAYPSNGCNDQATQGDPASGDTVCLTDFQLDTEIKNVIAAQGWPTGTGNLFFIFTPSDVGICFGAGSVINGNECSTNAFCAYHSNFLDGGSQIVYGVEPDNETIPTGGCDYNVQDPNGANVDPTINTISHEQNEAITDPLGTAWSTTDLNEIGDLCAWTFGDPVTPGGDYNQVINGDHYWLQEEYSNAARASGGCEQYLGGPANPPDPNLGGADGVGPLIDSGGAVMRTNTVHAIYWIPSASASGIPSNSQPPAVLGAAAVGKTLTTSTGSWSNSPTSYAHKWQSCSATGTGCVDIAGATSSTYKLTAADAGHELRSEVSAHNSSGTSSYVASTPTEVVVPLPVPIVAPAVSGIASVGKTLSTTQGAWNTPASYAYQWLRCSATGSSCSSISGATRSTHKLTPADAGHEIEARVSATNAAGTTAAVSTPTAAVLDHPRPSAKPRISGTAKVGEVLSTDPGSWTNSPTSFRYQWLRCSATGTACVPIAGATKPTYKLGRRDAKHKLRVRVTAINSAGSGKSTSGTTRVAAAARH